jgi:TonB family protein
MAGTTWLLENAIMPSVLDRCGVKSVLNLAVIVIGAIASSIAVAERRDVEMGLKNELEKKIVVVRGIYSGEKFRFDSNGNPVGKAVKGSWSSSGMVQVSRVSLDDKGLLDLKARRIVNVFNQEKGKFDNLLSPMNVQITIELGAASGSLESAKVVLDKIFTRDPNVLLANAGGYWTCWMSGRAARDEKGDWRCGGTPKLDARKPAPGEAMMGPTGVVIYRSGGDVKQPKPIHTPDPIYDEVAMKSGIHGTVVIWCIVDENGSPMDVAVARPLGAGLDDRAVEAVQSWRFSPATKAGTPVKVQINVEVNFRMK